MIINAGSQLCSVMFRNGSSSCDSGVFLMKSAEDHSMRMLKGIKGTGSSLLLLLLTSVSLALELDTRRQVSPDKLKKSD